jgi:hypothetical protein
VTAEEYHAEVLSRLDSLLAVGVTVGIVVIVLCGVYLVKAIWP